MADAGAPLVVIFGGANERAVVAFCRSLLRDGVSFRLVARSVRDPLYKTRYRRWIFARRDKELLDADEFRQILLRIQAAFPARRLFIAPSAESINRLLLGMADWLRQHGIHGIAVPERTYLHFSEKEQCLAAAQRAGLTIPQEYPAYEARYLPFVLKPRSEFSAEGERLYPLLVCSPAEFQQHAARYSPALHMLQRYIDGQSFYYLYFRNSGGIAALYQRNLAQQAAGKSIVAAELVECPDSDTDRRLRAMLEETDYCGFIMFEVMRSAGRDYLIEANPRLWGPMQLALENGFAARWLVLGDGCPPEPSKAVLSLGIWRRSRYFWLGGFVGQRRGEMRFFDEPCRVLRRFLWRLPCCDVWFAGDSFRLFLSELRKPDPQR
ncbi:hypothetical protein [Pseudomonas sp. LRF_L74]|uniref:hypothetical protein n=1 Tax=Pseudomonas sp. LRF_L74 TaxID=3369422 RepID=UPI003F60FBB8